MRQREENGKKLKCKLHSTQVHSMWYQKSTSRFSSLRTVKVKVSGKNSYHCSNKLLWFEPIMHEIIQSGGRRSPFPFCLTSFLIYNSSISLEKRSRTNETQSIESNLNLTRCVVKFYFRFRRKLWRVYQSKIFAISSFALSFSIFIFSPFQILPWNCFCRAQCINMWPKADVWKLQTSDKSI